MYQINGLSLCSIQVHEGSSCSWFGLRTYTVDLNCSFANSETTSVHQALQIWFPTKPPMFTIVDIVEQGHVPIFLTAANAEPTCAVGNAP